MHLRSASASWDYAKQKDTESGRAIWSRGDLELLSWRKPPTVFPTPQYADRAPANRVKIGGRLSAPLQIVMKTKLRFLEPVRRGLEAILSPFTGRITSYWTNTAWFKRRAKQVSGPRQ